MAHLDPITEFRDDHRKVRDGIIDITAAIKAKDLDKARGILGQLNEITGPHFRYEEEDLYPAMREFLGEYVDTLISEHNTIIETAKVCSELLAKDALTDEESAEAQKAAMALLVHVSNCDGLAILSERLDQKGLDDLGDKFQKARDAGVPLLDWAETIRAKA